MISLLEVAVLVALAHLPLLLWAQGVQTAPFGGQRGSKIPCLNRQILRNMYQGPKGPNKASKEVESGGPPGIRYHWSRVLVCASEVGSRRFSIPCLG